MNNKIIWPRHSVLTGCLLGLLLSPAAIAQSEQPAAQFEQVPSATEDRFNTQGLDSGLAVEERRFDNRLDGVTVRHKDSSVVDYYDLSDPDIQRREGGIIEGGAMRTWRLGTGKN